MHLKIVVKGPLSSTNSINLWSLGLSEDETIVTACKFKHHANVQHANNH